MTQRAQSPRLILASASPRRLALLRQIGFAPDAVRPAHIDEAPAPRETPRAYALRLAREKALAVDRDADEIILAADTAVACGRRILPKAETEAGARRCLDLLSGRGHRVYTAVAVLAPGAEAPRLRLSEARVKMKRLSAQEIDAYVASGEWRGKAGGYAIQGAAGAFVLRLVGSYTAVVGLPLYEAYGLLTAAGLTPPRGTGPDGAGADGRRP